MMLGKRKRDAVVMQRPLQNGSAIDDSSSKSQKDAYGVFQQYFETQFVPLAGLAWSTPSPEEEGQDETSDGESEASEWDGFSDVDPSFGTVEVINHGVLTASEDALVDSREIKTFMGTKPPTRSASQSAIIKSQPKTGDGETETTNLRNDLDLQRLLQESSLLKKRKEGSQVDRHRTTDLRLQALGLKSSFYSQDKMPMTHRQGIKAKAQSRDELRRKDARENGIILEKASKKGNSEKAKRERGIDAPGVGKFRGGTLKLSRRDVADVQGPKQNTLVGRRR